MLRSLTRVCFSFNKVISCWIRCSCSRHRNLTFSCCRFVLVKRWPANSHAAQIALDGLTVLELHSPVPYSCSCSSPDVLRLESVSLHRPSFGFGSESFRLLWLSPRIHRYVKETNRYVWSRWPTNPRYVSRSSLVCSYSSLVLPNIVVICCSFTCCNSSFFSKVWTRRCSLRFNFFIAFRSPLSRSRSLRHSVSLNWASFFPASPS